MGYGQNNQNQERQAFSLLELNNRVKGVILNAFPETCWVRAEMSDVRTNAALLSGVYRKERDNRPAGCKGTRFHLGENIPDAETLF